MKAAEGIYDVGDLVGGEILAAQSAIDAARPTASTWSISPGDHRLLKPSLAGIEPKFREAWESLSAGKTAAYPVAESAYVHAECHLHWSR